MPLLGKDERKGRTNEQVCLTLLLPRNDIVWEPWQQDLWAALKNVAKDDPIVIQTSKQEDRETEQDPQKLPMQMEKLSLTKETKVPSFPFWPLPRKSHEELPEEIIKPSASDVSSGAVGKVSTVRLSYVNNGEDDIFHDALAIDEEEASVLNPVTAQDVVMKRLTAKGAAKEVTLVSFTVTDSRWKCEAGDSFALCCENDPLAVDSLLEIFELDGSCLVKTTPLIPIMPGSLLEFIAEQTLSIREIFLKYIDIMHFPKKTLLRAMADFCKDASDQQNLVYLASKAGSSDYMTLANGHASLVDFVHTFRSCKPPLELLLGHLPALHPRFYSVCSAGSTNVSGPNDKQAVEFIYSCMDYKLPSGEGRRGVCSAWLERIKMRLQGGEDKIVLKVFPRPAPHFRLPEDPSTPMIMICAGTGVSPFIGFLRTLEKNKLFLAFTWLIFGFRHRSHDFLFADELENYKSLGILSRLTIATSRELDSGHPKYVQGALRAHAKELYELMKGSESARIYICGDELTMIKDVNVAIQEMLIEHGGMDAKQALNEFNSWNSTKRIIRDVWI